MRVTSHPEQRRVAAQAAHATIFGEKRCEDRRRGKRELELSPQRDGRCCVCVVNPTSTGVYRLSDEKLEERAYR